MYRPRTPSEGPADTLLNVATHLFYQRGISAVGVDTVVAQAGVSKGTLYRHFHSKDDLVAAVLHRSDEVWRQRLVEGIDQRATEPHEKLLAIFDWLADWFASENFRGCAFLNAAAELTPNHPAHQLPLEHKQAVGRFILGLARQAELADPQELADELLLLIDGAISHALLEHSALPAVRAKRLAALALANQTPRRGPKLAEPG